MKSALLILALAIVTVTASFALYHPPMRLMPAPQIFRADGTNPFGPAPVFGPDPAAVSAPVSGPAPAPVPAPVPAAVPAPAPAPVPSPGLGSVPASGPDSRIRLFFATNRLPLGPRENRLYTGAPASETKFGRSAIRIGDEATGWDEILRLSTTASGDGEDRPFLHLETMAETASLPLDAPPDAATLAWLAAVEADRRARGDPDIVVYVHGANTTVERGVGQAAQLHHFTGRQSTVVVFVWPTAENFLRYTRDLRTALGAAPHLARLVALLSRHTGARAIDILTYSAGGTLGSEAMALVAREPGGVPRLGEVYHAAPDADFTRFVADLKEYGPVAGRVSAAVNLNDSALRLAQAMNRGASRAGRPDMRELSEAEGRALLDATRTDGLEVVRVRPETIPGLSRSSHTFWYEDPWVSSDVLISLLSGWPAGERGLEAGATEAGGRYHTFPPDYPDRLPGVLDRLRAARAMPPQAAN